MMTTRSVRAEKTNGRSKNRYVTFTVSDDDSDPGMVHISVRENYSGRGTEYDMSRDEWEKLTRRDDR